MTHDEIEFREIKIKDDPTDDDDIDITAWIPDLEEMIARQDQDPSLVSAANFAPEVSKNEELCIKNDELCFVFLNLI